MPMPTEIDDLFPHIGETILQEMAKLAPEILLEPLGIPETAFVEVHRQVAIAFPQTTIIFDGFSTIDLALQLSDDTLFPIEVKLGFTGLGRATMNKNLAACSISKHRSERRITGKMPAILSRNFDATLVNLVGTDRLHGRIGDRLFPVRESWATIARDRINRSWTSSPPAFNEHHHALTLDTICAAFGKERFNGLVAEMFSDVDYYDRWIDR